jgi:hypothetical protein
MTSDQIVGGIYASFGKGDIPAIKVLRDEELHLWTLDDHGKVIGLRHYVDTAKHIDANTR